MIFPSLPTARLMRSNSLTIFWLRSRISLRVSAILPSTPIWSTGILTEKFPFLKAIRVLSRMLVSRAFEGRSATLVVFITINFLLGLNLG